VDRSQVFEAVVDQLAATLNASSAGLFELHEDTTCVSLSHAVGYSDAGKRALCSVPLDAQPSLPAVDSIRTGKPIWLSSQSALLADYPHLEALVTAGRTYQVACLPIVVQGQTRGALGLTFDNAPPIDEEQRGVLLLVAHYSGQALERLRLLEAERANRAHAERAAARADLLSQASRAFAEAATEMSSVLQAVMEQITNAHAELCGVSLVSANTLKLEALHHRDPVALCLLRDAIEKSPPQLDESASGRVVLTGQSLFVPVVDPLAARKQARAQYQGWLEQFMPRSVIIVPLRVRAKIIGTLGAFRGEGAAAFTEDDVRFLEELGERAAMAIETTRLYHDSRLSQKRTEVLYRLSRSVIAADNVNQVYDAALSALEEALGARRAAVLTLDDDCVMRVRASRGLSEDYQKAVEGHSPWPPGASNPEPIFIEQAQSAPEMTEFRKLLCREGIGALGFFPLVAGDKLVGKFMVYYDEPRPILEHELQMARAIADHVAAATTRFAAVEDLFRTVRFNEMFTGMLGHDLRNPLGAIMTAAQLAIRRTTDERTAKPLSRIVTSGNRMARMIDQLLDFTRVRVGNGIPIERKPLDLVPLLQQIIEELEGSVEGSAVQLQAADDVCGVWDADRLSQVFSNLVANAMQHGTPGPKVSVRLDSSHPDSVRIEVHNHGAIPPTLLSGLFEPMSGGEHRRARSQGLGLGLYISQQIVKGHGGTIEVCSSEERGTTFVVALPRASDHLTHERRAR
jgi:K+-sensing histidine kinase KdpD